MMEKILVTICARGGSKGVKNKNIRELNGQPLISYSIKQALNWRKATRVVVSTDSEEIASIAQKYGADVPFLRPGYLASDTSAKLPVIRHALQESQKIYNEDYSIIVDLDATAPIRTSGDLDGALAIFNKSDSSTLFSVVHAHKNPYFNMVEADAAGKIKLCKILEHGVIRRQDAPKVYSMNASIYFYRQKYLLDEANNSPISGNSSIYIMNDLAGIDIDREIDFKFIEFLIKEGVLIL